MNEGYYLIHFRMNRKSNLGLEEFEGHLKDIIDSYNIKKGSHSLSMMEIINNAGWKNFKEAVQDLNIEVRDIKTQEERILEDMGEGALNPDELEEIKKRSISA